MPPDPDDARYDWLEYEEEPEDVGPIGPRSLVDFARGAMMRCLTRYEDIGDLKFHQHPLFFEKMKPEQLWVIEENSPELQSETDHLWKEIVNQRDTLTYKKYSDPARKTQRPWREIYTKLEKIAAQRRIEAAAQMRAQYAEEEKKKARRSVQVVDVPASDPARGGRGGQASSMLNKIKRQVAEEKPGRPVTKVPSNRRLPPGYDLSSLNTKGIQSHTSSPMFPPFKAPRKPTTTSTSKQLAGPANSGVVPDVARRGSLISPTASSPSSPASGMGKDRRRSTVDLTFSPPLMTPVGAVRSSPEIGGVEAVAGPGPSSMKSSKEAGEEKEREREKKGGTVDGEGRKRGEKRRRSDIQGGDGSSARESRRNVPPPADTGEPAAIDFFGDQDGGGGGPFKKKKNTAIKRVAIPATVPISTKVTTPITPSSGISRRSSVDTTKSAIHPVHHTSPSYTTSQPTKPIPEIIDVDAEDHLIREKQQAEKARAAGTAERTGGGGVAVARKAPQLFLSKKRMKIG